MMNGAFKSLSEDELDTLVSIAIRRAELLEDVGAAEAADAWHEVMLYEERLAELTPPSEISGGVARAGAVRAALAAGQRLKADRLAAKYTSDAGLPQERRMAIERAFHEDRERRAKAFPSLAKNGRLAELDDWRARAAAAPPCFPARSLNPMETVAFYSYKGGVGRTLLVANTAEFLALSGRRVVALDLDLEAPGLHQKLGSSEVLARAKAGQLPGAVYELLSRLQNGESGHQKLGVADSRSDSLKIGYSSFGVDLPSDTKGSLIVVPAGSAPSREYWASLERLKNSLRCNRTGGGLAEAVLDLQARISEAFDPDFLLVDSRTGITELGGLATSILADRVVCMTTTGPESVEGTRVVAEALREAPRLSSQKPLRIDFLMTRVTSESSSNVSRLVGHFGGVVTILPHDPAIADEERILSNWTPARTDSSGDRDNHDAGTQLFSATLAWIARSFPGHTEDAERAQRRMRSVNAAWQYLTARRQRMRDGSSRSRDAWPVEQLRERVRFRRTSPRGDTDSRQADIVAYDSAPEGLSPTPQLVVEYVEGEDRDAVADWWLENAGIPVVAILSSDSGSGWAAGDRRLYSARSRWEPNARHSERWDLPLPRDFKALRDPTDVSVDAMLDAALRGHPDYVERLVTEWVRASASTLPGGGHWNPRIAGRIIQGLAQVDDTDIARQVLWGVSNGSSERGMWLGDGDEWLDEQVLAELFAPLLWRLPAEASIDVLRESTGRPGRGRSLSRPGGLLAVGLLARGTLGLYYDPDATFRREGQRVLDLRGPSGERLALGLYELAPAFRRPEISWEYSREWPPLFPPPPNADEEKPQEVARLGAILAKRVVASTLVTTGLLGDYQPSQGKVILYGSAISECADRLGLKPGHVGSVTLIHETLHALAHLGRDLDGRMWAEFALPDPSSPLFEPSWFHETVTQYFTYKHILGLQDLDLMNAFEKMTDFQAPAYRTWRQLRHVPMEDVRSWFMSVRRGTGSGTIPWQALASKPNDVG